MMILGHILHLNKKIKIIMSRYEYLEFLINSSWTLKEYKFLSKKFSNSMIILNCTLFEFSIYINLSINICSYLSGLYPNSL